MTRRWLAVLAIPLLCVASARGDDAKDLGGNWVPTAGEIDGQKLPDELLKSIKLHLDGGKYTTEVGKEKQQGTYKFDEKKTPKEMDITATDGPDKGKTLLAIYELSGDTLKVCYALEGKERPKEFKTSVGSKRFLVTYQRVK
jgi:uncharacterized protein (TIGR03067 family)